MNKYKMPEVLDLAYNKKYIATEVCESSIKTETNVKLRILMYNSYAFLPGSFLMKYVREHILIHIMYFNLGDLRGSFTIG